MAKNWNAAMAVEALNGNDDQRKELMFDAGRRFPIVTTSLVTLHAIASTSEVGKAAFNDILGNLPEWVTLRKIEAPLKADIVVEDEEEKVEKKTKKEEPKEDKKKKTTKKSKKVVEEPEEEDDEEEEKPKKKAKKAPAKKTKKVIEEPEDDDDDDDDDDWD